MSVPCENRTWAYRVPLLAPGCAAGEAEEKVSIEYEGYTDELDLCASCAELLAADAASRGLTVTRARLA